MKPRMELLPINPVRARRIIAYLGRIVFAVRNIFFILILIVVAGGIGFTVFDGKSIAEGQYLALITAMTIGYGDLAPLSWPARIVAGIVGLNGLILTGVVIACVVKALELAFREDLDELTKVSDTNDPDSHRASP